MTQVEFIRFEESFHTPTTGMVVGVWDGTHCTRMEVVKVNRRTFDCVELPRSHSAGRRWRVHVDAQYCVHYELPDGRHASKWFNSL